MSRSTVAKKPTKKVVTDDHPAKLDVLLDSLRSMWVAAEKETKLTQSLQATIAKTIEKLEQSVCGKLKLAVALDDRNAAPIPKVTTKTRPPQVFDRPIPSSAEPESVIHRAPSKAIVRFQSASLRTYDKDLSSSALSELPNLAGLHSIEEARSYLIKNLRFNSEATRRRYANYLINRFFPGEYLHQDVVQFCEAMKGRQALGEALFYLTCRTELIVAKVAEELVFPSLVAGGVTRVRIRDLVKELLPDSKSPASIGAATVRTYEAFGIGTATTSQLNPKLREGCLATFAYILHLEFPEPGMHTFEKMLNGPMHRWLLWDQAWMIQQLYRLRETGLLSKVSEIDRMRQFTTKFDVAGAMPQILALAKEQVQ